MQVSEIGGRCQTEIDVDYNEAFCSQIILRTLDILLDSIDILTPVIPSQFDLLESCSSPAERNNVPDIIIHILHLWFRPTNLCEHIICLAMLWSMSLMFLYGLQRCSYCYLYTTRNHVWPLSLDQVQ